MRGEGPSLEIFGATGVAGDERPGDDSYLLVGGAEANLFAVGELTGEHVPYLRIHKSIFSGARIGPHP